MFIFLIDANPLISEWLKRLADKTGQRFYHLGKLDEAAFFIDDLRPDVVVLDGETAAKSQGEFLQNLSEFPFVKEVPVVGLGAPLPEWVGHLNIRGHLQKPLNPAQFYEKVRALL